MPRIYTGGSDAPTDFNAIASQLEGDKGEDPDFIDIPGLEPGTLVTLGDPNTNVTCSMDAAKKIRQNIRTIGARNFMDAADMVKTKQADYLIMPAAFKEAAEVIFDDGLRLISTFHYTLPNLVAVLVDNNPEPNLSGFTTFLPPTGNNLAERITAFKVKNTVPTSSNEEAAKRLMLSPRGGAAVTNALVARYYDLPIVQIIIEAAVMPFFVFMAKGGVQ